MLQHEIEVLDKAGLRQFGFMMAGFLGILLGGVLPFLRHSPYPLWPWILSTVFVIWAVIHPMSINIIYKPWMHVAMFIGGIINAIIMGIIYYCVFVPMGSVMRLLGKDPMVRQLNPKLQSYRVNSNVPTRTHIERPF